MYLRRTTKRKTTMDLFHMKTFSFLCLLLNAIPCEGFESCCTKVDSVELLLEKTVRFKFEMRQIINEYTQMVNELLEERKNIKNEREMMIETIENLMDQNLRKLNTLEGGVKDTREKLVNDVNDATTTIEVTQQQNEAKLMRLSADLDETIQNVNKTLSATPDVFFMAKVLADHGLSNKQTFVFTTVVENEMGGYNDDNGVFTVPVDGEYLFTTQLCSFSYQLVHFAFTIDGQRNTLTMFNGGKGYTCTTATLIARVKKGSRVEVQSINTSRATCDEKDHGCYFSGYLLKQTLY